MSEGANEVTEALNRSNQGSNGLNNSRQENASQEKRHPFFNRYTNPLFKCCITMCNTSWSINYTPLCMTFVFFSMAIVTFAVSSVMSVYNDYRETTIAKKVEDITQTNTYELILDLTPLGGKKNTEFILLYGMKGFRQVKLYPSLLKYSVVTKVTSNEAIFNSSSQPVGIYSMFNDTFECEFLDVNDAAVSSPCSCDENSIIFPFADKLIPASFGFKPRLINWLDLSPYETFYKPLCKIKLPNSQVMKIKITGTKKWNFWNNSLTKGLEEFYIRAAIPSLFGGNTKFLEIMGFALGGFCTFVGIIVLGAYFHQRRGRNQ